MPAHAAPAFSCHMHSTSASWMRFQTGAQCECQCDDKLGAGRDLMPRRRSCFRTLRRFVRWLWGPMPSSDPARVAGSRLEDAAAPSHTILLISDLHFYDPSFYRFVVRGGGSVEPPSRL